ncbi:MAG: sugar phosphate isomerase/epimerase [Anaerolineae bacterium]|nr:sugar phosphate isomerase/epimerase [Anaerolineae bacterium]
MSDALSYDLAYSSACFPPESREQEMLRAPELGVNRCEIALRLEDLNGTGRWPALLDRTGLVCWSVHTPFGASVDLSALERRTEAVGVVLESVDLAASLGAGMVVVHGGAEPIPADLRCQRLRAARESLRSVAERCEILGLRMALEYLPRTCPGNSVAELEYLLSGISPDVAGICLDLNHANLRQDLTSRILALSGRIITVHVSDNDGLDERHWLPGQGVIEWEAALRALVQAGYRGPFMYEASRDRSGGAVSSEVLFRNYERRIRPLLDQGVTGA